MRDAKDLRAIRTLKPQSAAEKLQPIRSGLYGFYGRSPSIKRTDSYTGGVRVKSAHFGGPLPARTVHPRLSDPQMAL